MVEVAQIEVIPISNRACDLCNDNVTTEEHKVTKSFVLTDWGVICIRCWDDRIEHHGDFDIIKIYIAAQRVDDAWITRPLILSGPAPGRAP